MFYSGIVLVLGGLSAVNYYVMSREISIAPALPTHVASYREAKSPQPQSISSPAVNDIDRSEILSRPLFQPNRKPAPKTPQPVQQAAPIILPPDLKLVGILSDQRARRALLRSARLPQGKWFDLGSSLEGWTLSSIETTSATLKAGDRTERLELIRPVANARATKPQAGGPEPTVGPTP